MSDDPTVDAAMEELRRLKARLAQLEKMARQVPAPDKPASFGDALDALRRTGSARGPAIDALRAAVEGPGMPATAPSRDQLAEAARVVSADLRGSASIEGAYRDMQARASRRNAVEMADPGALGRVDPTDPATATAIDRLRTALSEEH